MYHVIINHTEDIKNNPEQTGGAVAMNVSKSTAKKVVSQYRKEWLGRGYKVQRFVNGGYAATITDDCHMWTEIIEA